MNKIENNSIQKKLFVITSFLAMGLLVIASVSFLFPNSPVGYSRLFVDSHTNSYKLGSDFTYDKYIFNIKLTESAIEPQLNDCSNLLEGGIFNPNSDAFFAKQTSPNYWPKEDCVASNKKITDEANLHKNINITYSIKNRSGDIGTIKNGWMTVYAEDGTTLYNGGNEATITPENTIHNEVKATANNSKISNIAIKLPDHATQLVK